MLTDDSVAQYTGSPSYGLTTGQIQGAVEHFSSSYLLQGSTWTSGFDINTVVSHINLGHPVIVEMNIWGVPGYAGGGHASVIVGYRYDTNTGTYTPYTYDLGTSNGWMHDINVLDFSMGGTSGGW